MTEVVRVNIGNGRGWLMNAGGNGGEQKMMEGVQRKYEGTAVG